MQGKGQLGEPGLPGRQGPPGEPGSQVAIGADTKHTCSTSLWTYIIAQLHCGYPPTSPGWAWSTWVPWETWQSWTEGPPRTSRWCHGGHPSERWHMQWGQHWTASVQHHTIGAEAAVLWWTELEGQYTVDLWGAHAAVLCDYMLTCLVSLCTKCINLMDCPSLMEGTPGKWNEWHKLWKHLLMDFTYTH